jgi:hypothetical protein
MSKSESSHATATPNPLQSLAEQIVTMERQALDRMKTSMQEAARLYVDALDYAVALSSHWRSFAVDAVRRATDLPAR